MLEVIFGKHSVLIAVYLLVAGCQGDPFMSLPLSNDSFRQIKRIFTSAPKGRKSDLSDTRINYYSYNINIPGSLQSTVYSQYEKGLAIVHHAGHVWIGRLHTPLRTLWRTLRRAVFFTIFSFKLNEIDVKFKSDSERNCSSYVFRSVHSLLSNPTFDPRKPTVFYIHGYIETASDNSVATVVKAYVAHGGFNILALDWGNLAYGDYINVLLNVKSVGNEAGKALLNLVKRGLNISKIHIVGHSMGVHVAAVIARYLKTRGYIIPRITALDAAYPGFYPPIQTVPLSTDDAEFVDTIHTDGGWFGASTSIGHVDFWPNGGTATQPGCLPFTLPLTVENFCNHWRSWQYWTESVDGGNFLARKCNSYEEFRHGRCDGTAAMGLAATPELRGNYYLRTASQEPFALGERGATFISPL